MVIDTAAVVLEVVLSGDIQEDDDSGDQDVDVDDDQKDTELDVNTGVTVGSVSMSPVSLRYHAANKAVVVRHPLPCTAGN